MRWNVARVPARVVLLGYGRFGEQINGRCRPPSPPRHQTLKVTSLPSSRRPRRLFVSLKLAVLISPSPPRHQTLKVTSLPSSRRPMRLFVSLTLAVLISRENGQSIQTISSTVGGLPLGSTISRLCTLSRLEMTIEPAPRL